MQRKVEGSPNVESMLSAVRDLRKEREKVKELQTQKTEQRTTIGKSKTTIVIAELPLCIYSRYKLRVPMFSFSSF